MLADWFLSADEKTKILIVAAVAMIVTGVVFGIWVIAYSGYDKDSSSVKIKTRRPGSNNTKRSNQLPPVEPAALTLTRHAISNSDRGGVTIAIHSAIGDRQTQQDYVLTPDAAGVSAELTDATGHLTVLCDGMGGLAGGALASLTCCNLMMNDYYSKEHSSIRDYFENAVLAADEAVYKLTDDNGNRLHAGTTMTAVLVKNNLVYWASVGDSRIYRYRNGSLELITRDHNYLMRLMELVGEGEVDLDEAKTHPKREALISYVGIGDIELMDIYPDGMEFAQGDMILMCSDGLYKSLDDSEIEQIMERLKQTPDMLSVALVNAALEKPWMKKDNITIAVISCTGTALN